MWMKVIGRGADVIPTPPLSQMEKGGVQRDDKIYVE